MTRAYKLTMHDPRPCGYCGRVYQPYVGGQRTCRECTRTASSDRLALKRDARGQGAEYVRCVRDDPGGLYRAGQDYWMALVRQDCCAGLASRESFRWEAQ